MTVDTLKKEMFVLTLSLNGYKLREIATIMGITESRVQQIKRKALVRIKFMWRDYEAL